MTDTYLCKKCGKEVKKVIEGYCLKCAKKKSMPCAQCKTEFVSRSIKQKYCSPRCFRKSRYQKLKQNPEWVKEQRARSLLWEKNNYEQIKERKKIYFKAWYAKNKERHKQNVYRWMKQANRDEVNARQWVGRYRKQILAIVGNKCVVCGKPAEELHSKKLVAYEHRDNKLTNPKQVRDNVIPYCVEHNRAKPKR